MTTSEIKKELQEILEAHKQATNELPDSFDLSKNASREIGNTEAQFNLVDNIQALIGKI